MQKQFNERTTAFEQTAGDSKHLHAKIEAWPKFHTLHKNWLKTDHGLRQNYVNILEQNIVGDKEQNPGLSKVLKWHQKHNSGAPGSSVN